jgi:hypothetical protein
VRAQLHRLDRLALAAQRAVVEGLDLVAAAGALFDLLGEDVDGHALVRVLRGGDVDAHDGLRAGGGHQAEGKAKAQGEGTEFHGVGLLQMVKRGQAQGAPARPLWWRRC